MTPDQLVKRSGSSRRDYEARVDGSTRLMQTKRQQAMADAAAVGQKATDDALQTSINAERAARVYADMQEGQARIAADTAEAAARVQGDDAERMARMTADGVISGMVDALGAALANEVTSRTGANQTEATARNAAISSTVLTEATARIAADKTNADAIAKEITDRAAADALLDTKINGRVKKISLGNVSAQFGAALLGLGVRTPLDVNVAGLRIDDGLIEVRPTSPMPAGYVMMQAYIKSAGVMTMIFYTPSLTLLSPMVTITFEVVVLRSGA